MLAQEHKLYTISKLAGESTHPDSVSRLSINMFLKTKLLANTSIVSAKA